MSQSPDRGLLIAILAVCVAILTLVGVQTAMIFRQAPAPNASVATESLPSSFTDDQLAEIAELVSEPFNRGDLDAIYELLDPIAKTQISRADVEKNFGPVISQIGKIDSAAYVGFQRLPSQGSFAIYQLNYAIRLSGGPFESGSMRIQVIDRADKIGIAGFFVNGGTG